MSRSLAVASSGGKTQLTGFLSAGLLILVLLWIGPLFEQLPKVPETIIKCLCKQFTNMDTRINQPNFFFISKSRQFYHPSLLLH